MAANRFRTVAELDAFVAGHGNPFDSIPREVMEALLESSRADLARYNALNPPHLAYEQDLKRFRDALAQVDAMEHPTEDDLWRRGHFVQSLKRLEEQGPPPAPLPDAKFTPLPPGLQ